MKDLSRKEEKLLSMFDGLTPFSELMEKARFRGIKEEEFRSLIKNLRGKGYIRPPSYRYPKGFLERCH